MVADDQPDVPPSWRDLAADSGSLISVLGDRAPSGRYGKLALVFSHGTMLLACDDNTDEIQVSVAQEPPVDLPNVEVDPDLMALVGMVIEYAWTLENHRGYRDAIQIRFLDLDSRDERTLQFEVAASAITITRVIEA
jgi:hypothetical protein